MKPKLLIAGGLLAAFLTGIVFQAHAPFGTPKSDTAFASSQPATRYATSYATRRVVSPAQPYATERAVAVQETPAPRKHRSWEREVLIVGGSSAAGAGIGALAGGGKGAGIGAASGAVAGLVYDLATRNK
jgi:hypothetical protein